MLYRSYALLFLYLLHYFIVFLRHVTKYSECICIFSKLKNHKARSNMQQHVDIVNNLKYCLHSDAGFNQRVNAE